MALREKPLKMQQQKRLLIQLILWVHFALEIVDLRTIVLS